MEEIKVTWKYAVRIWWSWVWRAMLWTFPTALLVGFLMGFILSIAGVSTEPYQPYLQLIGALIGIFFGIYAVKVVMTKRFNGYRIALVKTDTTETSTIDV
ncbi:hypothetical protein [Bowmanella dokdonensis]|uniref:Uncharacterized protein n=1 Tax=Bowmanella dokdonensis TaxID=751969 RepID=A0A939DJ63_9ALTE|nr:hypothetical protein [Bowmanella dokdonensis]MBN7823668.1 hypothetical protein [Bowmanella dokdonensis]